MQDELRQKSAPRIWMVGVLITGILAFGAGLFYGKNSQVHAAQLGRYAVASASTNTITGVDSAPPSGLVQRADFSKFWNLWRMLEEKYYKQPLDEQRMLYGAMSGLASSVGDPYTVFFEPKTAEEFAAQLKGSFGGIGAEIGIKDDQLQVVAPLPGTPADKAGLKAGDAILKIDKQETVGMAVDTAVSLIRGAKGTSVTLSIGRFKLEKDKVGKIKKTPTVFDVTIVRDQIEVKSVTTKYLPSKIAMIQVHSFGDDTQGLFSKAVQDVVAKDSKGLILDLRNDPGGYLDRAISMAGEWVCYLAVVKERRQGKIVEEYRGNPTERLRDMPTIVLVNGGSASAAEIVAGALQDYKKAKLVGTKTFGKGSVQDYVDLPDGSAVKITIAEWLTPNERSINKVGILPDVTVEITQDDYNAARDPQLDRAVELLTGKPSTTAASVTTSTTGSKK